MKNKDKECTRDKCVCRDNKNGSPEPLGDGFKYCPSCGRKVELNTGKETFLYLVRSGRLYSTESVTTKIKGSGSETITSRCTSPIFDYIRDKYGLDDVVFFWSDIETNEPLGLYDNRNKCEIPKYIYDDEKLIDIATNSYSVKKEVIMEFPSADDYKLYLKSIKE